MRYPNFLSTASNRASLSITQTLYDRRALDCTSSRPLVQSLQRLMVLTSSSSRVRETLCQDGGLERLVQIMKEKHDPNDVLAPYKWHLCMQCLLNLGARGSEQVRMRVLEAGAIPVIATVLDNYLVAHGDSLEHRDHHDRDTRDSRLCSRMRSQTGQPSAQMPTPPPQTERSSASTTTTSTALQQPPQSQSQRQLVGDAFFATPAAAANTSNLTGATDPATSTAAAVAAATVAATEPTASFGDSMNPPDPFPPAPAPAFPTGSDSETYAEPAAGSAAGLTGGAASAETDEDGDPQLSAHAEHFLNQFTQATGRTVLNRRAQHTNEDAAAGGAPLPGMLPQQQRSALVPDREPANSLGLMDIEGGMAQFVNGLLIPREQDVFWALEIIAFVSKYSHLRREMQDTHFLPQLSLRPQDELFPGGSSSDASTSGDDEMEDDYDDDDDYDCLSGHHQYHDHQHHHPHNNHNNHSNHHNHNNHASGRQHRQHSHHGASGPHSKRVQLQQGQQTTSVQQQQPQQQQQQQPAQLPQEQQQQQPNQMLYEDIEIQDMDAVSDSSSSGTANNDMSTYDALSRELYRTRTDVKTLEGKLKAMPPPPSLDDVERAYYTYDFENNVDFDEEYLTRTVNLFELVERFTAFRAPREFPHWACIIMRNFVRKDEGGIRQCANFACGKWEEYPRQFAKCRRCKRTKYCSKACQLKAWSMHRYWCAPSPSSSQSQSASSQSTVVAQQQTVAVPLPQPQPQQQQSQQQQQQHQLQLPPPQQQELAQTPAPAMTTTAQQQQRLQQEEAAQLMYPLARTAPPAVGADMANVEMTDQVRFPSPLQQPQQQFIQFQQQQQQTARIGLGVPQQTGLGLTGFEQAPPQPPQPSTQVPFDASETMQHTMNVDSNLGSPVDSPQPGTVTFAS